MVKEADAMKVHRRTADRTSNPEAIAKGIEHTRGQISETLAAIADRLSPEHLVNEAMAALTKATDDITGEVSAAADDVAKSALKAANAAERELEK